MLSYNAKGNEVSKTNNSNDIWQRRNYSKTKKSAPTFTAVLMSLVAARVGYPAFTSSPIAITSLSTFPAIMHKVKNIKGRDIRPIV